MTVVIDERFYPATDRVDWEPLHKLVPEEFWGDFMFMEVEPGGRRLYKHGTTRGHLAVDEAGRPWGKYQDGGWRLLDRDLALSQVVPEWPYPDSRCPHCGKSW